MDINQVRFGNYTIGNSQANLGKKENSKKEDVQQQAQPSNNLAKINADDLYNAMNIAGLQNKAQISFQRKESLSEEKIEALVNKYLTPERISDIEAAMGKFDAGVNQAAKVIESEFPGAFNAADKLSLAAKVYANQ